MTATTLFVNNRSQAVRLPAQARFPASVKRVQVRIVGADRVISPVEQLWDSFFNPEPGSLLATDDFMAERATQTQSLREAF